MWDLCLSHLLTHMCILQQHLAIEYHLLMTWSLTRSFMCLMCPQVINELIFSQNHYHVLNIHHSWTRGVFVRPPPSCEDVLTSYFHPSWYVLLRTHTEPIFIDIDWVPFCFDGPIWYTQYLHVWMPELIFIYMCVLYCVSITKEFLPVPFIFLYIVMHFVQFVTRPANKCHVNKTKLITHAWLKINFAELRI